MYETAMLRPFKLKTTNGDMNTFYGNCHINITSVPFDNIKNRNKTDTPFELVKSNTYEHKQKTIKIATTTHVLSINAVLLFGDNTPEGIKLSAQDENFNRGTVQMIPNLNNPEVFRVFNNFINSIIDRQIKKTFSSIFYNLTHGNTPYSNIDYQDQLIANVFALNRDDSDASLWLPLRFYPSGVNNYSQNAIIFFSGANQITYMKTPFFLYQKDTYCRLIDNAPEFNTMPSYGISLDSYQTIYFYWTTYKGV